MCACPPDGLPSDPITSWVATLCGTLLMNREAGRVANRPAKRSQRDRCFAFRIVALGIGPTLKGR